MNSHAKANIFLKIIGTRGAYHELFSRFILIENLYDEIEFVSGDFERIQIFGDFDCKPEQNTIHKAIIRLKEHTNSPRIDEFFKKHAIKVQKNIPAGAGLGGGSSNAAKIIETLNEHLSLGLDSKELICVGKLVGADVPFFLSGFKSANVSGIGEVIEQFSDDIPEIKITTPKIHCDTKEVYKNFREKFFKTADSQICAILGTMSTKSILQNYKNDFLNDLLMPALDLYPVLKEYSEKNYFLSGSGSSFFMAA